MSEKSTKGNIGRAVPEFYTKISIDLRQDKLVTKKLRSKAWIQDKQVILTNRLQEIKNIPLY